MVRTYDFLFVVSGEESAERIKELTQSVEAALQEVGATNIVSHELGKRRLSYKLKGNIRFGTYVLTVCSVDPEKIALFHDKVRYLKGIVRSVLRAGGTTKVEEIVATFAQDEAPRRTEETTPERVAEFSPEVAMHTAETVEEKMAATVTPAAPKLSQEELDRRIDALLEKDIDPEKM